MGTKENKLGTIGRLHLDGEYRVIEGDTETYWRNKMYSSVDGADLRDCFKTSLNNNWIDARLMLVAMVFLVEIISSITKSGLTLSLLRVEQEDVEEWRGQTGYVVLVVML